MSIRLLSGDSLLSCVCLVFFLFKQKTAYEMRISDWSSDVCSSDLTIALARLKHSSPILNPTSAFSFRLYATAVPDIFAIYRVRTRGRQFCETQFREDCICPTLSRADRGCGDYMPNFPPAEQICWRYTVHESPMCLLPQDYCLAMQLFVEADR